MNIQTSWTLCVLSYALVACGEAPRPVPAEWAQREAVAGQPLPVPTVWLNGDPEARYTHNIKLPDSVPKPVPFDFKAAERKAWWPRSESVGIQYLRHLCATEAGEWTFKKVPSQSSIYQARPLFQPDVNKGYERLESPLAAWSSPPWDWRDRKEAAGAFLIRPGPMLFETVEEPRRPLAYQQAIQTPYIRIQHIQGEEISISPSEKLISTLGISWRGTARERDRELGISGIEWIVYNIQNGDVLAVRRNFMMSGHRTFLAAACAKVTWSSQFKESHFYVTNLVIPPKSDPMDYQTPFFETSKASPSEIKR